MTGQHPSGDDPNRRRGNDRERYVTGRLFDKVRRSLGRVPFVADALAAYYCAVDPRTPAHVKAVVLGALAYFITPVDALPDLLPLLGFTDDAAVFWFAWRQVAGHVTEDHRQRARAFLARAGGGDR